MIIVNVEQGSEAWFSLKAGVPSASSFDKIVTTKGASSKQREKYMYKLAGEKIIGKCEETYKNDIMQRGIDMEAEARALYEMDSGMTVKTVGVCYPNEKKEYLCSPDGLIGKIGGLEIKCPIISTHVSYLLNGTLPSDYFQQIQGSMLVTGRKWWDFMSYYPGMKPLIIRVERDEAFISSLKIELAAFCAELPKITERIK